MKEERDNRGGGCNSMRETSVCTCNLKKLVQSIGLYGRRNEEGSYAEVDDNNVVTVRNKDGGMLMQMPFEDWEALRNYKPE